MANYRCISRTNYFRVTDEKKYKELFACLTAEDKVLDFSKKIDGKQYHAFGAYSEINFKPINRTENETDILDIDEFAEALQPILPKGEAFIYHEAGHEKLCYILSYAVIATHDKMTNIMFDNTLKKTAQEMLHDTLWETKFDF